MLKIKDDVDLKELKKFGFKLKPVTGAYRKEIKSSHMDNCYIEAQKTRRILAEIRIKHEYIGSLKSTNTSDLDTLYDLIQARISGEGGIKYDRRILCNSKFRNIRISKKWTWS